MSKGKQVAISDARVARQEFWRKELGVGNAEIVWPERVAGQSANRDKRLEYCARWSRRVWVLRMPDNSDKAVLCERARSESLVTYPCKPLVRLVVLDVCRINKGNEHVDVQQVDGHGSSSRSWLTSSGVTGVAPRRLASSGTPFRSVRPGRVPLARPCLASVEITSPTLLWSRSARCLAAARTSSSMARVVRTVRLLMQCIIHQASLAGGQSRFL
jgi:hypothetical protein